MQRSKFRIKNLDIVITSDKIKYDKEQAYIEMVVDDDEYVFDVISCAARPVEFSIVNRLYNLDKNAVTEACDECNRTRKIGILTTYKYHLCLTPFVEKYSFFGKEQAQKLTYDVIEECKFLGAESLRITQFCMMRGHMPFYDQFKGIIQALITMKDSPLRLVYFDVPDAKFYELNTLFKSYEDLDDQGQL
ncbi:MAG: hypothetical protein NW207_06750 [Cytophagales bacterium]|nr:hypothetical protein [Cytophagales bacterium]